MGKNKTQTRVSQMLFALYHPTSLLTPTGSIIFSMEKLRQRGMPQFPVFIKTVEIQTRELKLSVSDT
jgi:hypothetical protein